MCLDYRGHYQFDQGLVIGGDDVLGDVLTVGYIRVGGYYGIILDVSQDAKPAAFVGRGGLRLLMARGLNRSKISLPEHRDSSELSCTLYIAINEPE